MSVNLLLERNDLRQPCSTNWGIHAIIRFVKQDWHSPLRSSNRLRDIYDLTDHITYHIGNFASKEDNVIIGT